MNLTLEGLDGRVKLLDTVSALSIFEKKVSSAVHMPFTMNEMLTGSAVPAHWEFAVATDEIYNDIQQVGKEKNYDDGFYE